MRRAQDGHSCAQLDGLRRTKKAQRLRRRMYVGCAEEWRSAAEAAQNRDTEGRDRNACGEEHFLDVMATAATIIQMQ